MTRHPYSDAELRRFMALARGGRDSRRELHAAMRRHPAGFALDAGTRVLSGPAPIPRDWPATTNADGSPSEPLPTTYPEDHQ